VRIGQWLTAGSLPSVRLKLGETETDVVAPSG
jgi:hypothetical protein